MIRFSGISLNSILLLIIIQAFTLGFLTGCIFKDPDEYKNRAIEIQELERQYKINSIKVIDTTTARLMIVKYQEFVGDFSEDSICPVLLKKAGELAVTIGEFSEAIEINQKIINDYPLAKESKNAEFIRGYIYENYLKNYNQAKAIYEEFIRNHPGDELSITAQFSIDNLGKSPDEIIEKLNNDSL